MEVQPPSSIFGNGREPTDTTHLRGKIFHFFGLPRELRDDIYERLLDRENVLFSKFGVRTKLLNRPRPHLLLVGGRFQKELQEQASRPHCLFIEGDFIGHPHLLTKTLKSSSAAAAHLVTAYCAEPPQVLHQVPAIRSLKDIRGYNHFRTHFIDKLPELTASRQVSVDLYLRMNRFPDNRVVSQLQSDITILTKGCAFKSFNIYFQLWEPHDPNVPPARQWRPWEPNFYHEDDKLILSYSCDKKGFECVWEEDSNQHKQAEATDSAAVEN